MNSNLNNTKDIICFCYGITEAEIKNILFHHKCTTIHCIQNYCNAGKGCKTCLPDIQNLIYKNS